MTADAAVLRARTNPPSRGVQATRKSFTDTSPKPAKGRKEKAEQATIAWMTILRCARGQDSPQALLGAGSHPSPSSFQRRTGNPDGSGPHSHPSSACEFSAWIVRGRGWPYLGLDAGTFIFQHQYRSALSLYRKLYRSRLSWFTPRLNLRVVWEGLRTRCTRIGPARSNSRHGTADREQAKCGATSAS